MLMKIHKKYLFSLLPFCFAALVANAQTSSWDKPIASSAVITSKDHLLRGAGPLKRKPIVLMNIRITNAQKQMLQQFNSPEEVGFSSRLDFSILPSKANVSMNGTPVM